jgi:hypothetical protein
MAAGDRLERYDFRACYMPSPFPAMAFGSHQGSARPSPSVTTGGSHTPIDAFSITRFGGGVVPEEKLWGEFDAERVAKFRRRRGRGRTA